LDRSADRKRRRQQRDAGIIDTAANRATANTTTSCSSGVERPPADAKVQYDAEGRQIRVQPPTSPGCGDDGDVTADHGVPRDEKCANAANNNDVNRREEEIGANAAEGYNTCTGLEERESRGGYQPAKIRGTSRQQAPFGEEQPQEDRLADRRRRSSIASSGRSSFEDEREEEEWYNGNSFTCRQCSVTLSGSLRRMQLHLKWQHGCLGSQQYNIIRTEQYYTCQICGEQVRFLSFP
jgi:hypothetical protein